ncbi:TIGR04255 family protein [Rugamonas rivuli]|uniref:TIGR04255 family protein n=1 Tax=Rugamonas rivuli TaxID=2743358 RepID=A0A843SMN0_9BURK|nr:TIGR04255 family protein [Rugamonas rivuli]MQA23453.1 TIGR04255 family protein [Rugamonas rivuli]
MLEPVKCDNPPVVEVVCGVMFASSVVQAVHIGAFWDRIRSEFPTVEEAPPLSAIVEEPSQSVAEFESWATLPPARRAWLLNRDGSNLIQIQADRFLFNWKHTLGTKNYPSYQVVITEFERRLQSFMDFMRDIGGVSLIFRQFEMTYVNHINKEYGLDQQEETSILVDHTRQSRTRFLPQPENFNFSSSYLLPEGAGRLHVTAQSMNSPLDDTRLVRLDMTARGMASDASDESRRKWFDTAHHWITHGFVDITSPTVQREIWKRTT